MDDPIGPNPQRTQPSQPALERVPSVWIAFEQSERLLNGVDQRPVELEQLGPGATREHNSRHRSSRGSALSELTTQIVELNGFLA